MLRCRVFCLVVCWCLFVHKIVAFINKVWLLIVVLFCYLFVHKIVGFVNKVVTSYICAALTLASAFVHDIVLFVFGSFGRGFITVIFTVLVALAYMSSPTKVMAAL